jgi:predicted GNAT family acetyltransferase
MQKLNLEIDSNIESFLEKAGEFLNRESGVHSFLLSLAQKYRDSGKSVHFAARALDQSGKLKVAGIQTESNRPMIISNAPAEDTSAFAELLSNHLEALPGINGPAPGIDAFAETWKAKKRCQLKLIMNLRLFELDKVKEPQKAPGFFRPAEASDEEVLFKWLVAFHNEAVPHDPISSPEDRYRSIRDGTKKQQWFVWEDSGVCVCLLGSMRETDKERWIAPVYTPPELRGRGYASSLVAAVSQRIVDSGKKGMLFTDLANPTSNSIYSTVGYQPIIDFKQINFY